MKDAYYFPHDYNARNDEKILSLLQEKGAAGYGNYWMIIEMLYEAGGVMRLHYERIAFALRTHCDEVKAIIHNFDLFEVCEPGIGKDGKQIPASFTSRRVLENIKMKNQKSKKASESAGRRWDTIQKPCDGIIVGMRPQIDTSEDAMRTQCERIDSEMRTQCDGNAIKERKGDELNEKKEKETPPLPPNEKNQQNQGFQPDQISSQSRKCESLSNQLTTQTSVDEEIDLGLDAYCKEMESRPEPECTEIVTEQYQQEINSKPVTPATPTEDRAAETKKRQKIKRWFDNYLSVHPKKVKQPIAEQVWFDIFFNPTLSDDDADKLYAKIMRALSTQKANYTQDAIYQYFASLDRWLIEERWKDEIETRKPETIEEQAARLRKAASGATNDGKC